MWIYYGIISAAVTTKGFIVSSMNIWCPAEAVFIPSRRGFVPGCRLQKAFSLSWIIQWEHPVDEALGFETRARHLTHTQNRGLQVVCGVAPVVPPDLSLGSILAALLVLNEPARYKTFTSARFSLHLLPRCFDLTTAEVPVVKPSPSLCFCWPWESLSVQ